MKKFFLLAFLILLISCSNDDFKEPKLEELLGSEVAIGSTKDIVTCRVGDACYEISESACNVIGGDIRNDEKCINFTCEWSPKNVKYGDESRLNFQLDSTGQENCSWEISYKDVPLQSGTDYSISPSTFPGLSYLNDTNIIAEATVKCKNQTVIGKCGKLEMASLPSPTFTCGWYPNQVKYGEESHLNFQLDNAGHKDCSEKISYKGTQLPSDANYTISASIFSGLKYSEDSDIEAEVTVTCKDQVIVPGKCTALKVASVPGPVWAQDKKLSFKKADYDSNGIGYFFGGSTVNPADIINPIVITNKEEAKCNDIEIRVTGSPTKPGTPVKAIAVVKCEYTGEFKLDSISAEVLPDYEIGDCALAGDSKTTMRSDETLTLDISVSNNYGRCNKIEYTLSGSSDDYVEENSFPLTSYGNKDLDKIYAKVTCGAATPEPKKCPTVKVASYVKTKCGANGDRDAIPIAKGTTILEFTCDKTSDQFYISCRPGPNSQPPDYTPKHTYTIEIEGYSVGNTSNDIRAISGDNGYNFPDLIVQEGDLYVYPEPIIITTAEEDLTCGIW